MTHWKKLHNYDYLGAYSLDDGKDRVLTIKEVVQEQVVSDGGRKEMCMVVRWAEDEKPMIMNKTNSKMVQMIYGTPNIEEWVGKKIQLFADTTKLKGEVVECLRIRPKSPEKELLTPEHKAWEKAIKYVLDGGETSNITKNYTLDERFEAEVSRRRPK